MSKKGVQAQLWVSKLTKTKQEKMMMWYLCDFMKRGE